MHESFPQPIEQPRSELPIEKVPTEQEIERAAKSEKNETSVMFERLRDPYIKKQLADHIEDAYQQYESEGHTERRWKVDQDGKDVFESDGSHVIEEVPYKAPSREDIVQKIDSLVEDAQKGEMIDDGDGKPNIDGIHRRFVFPRTGRVFSPKELSIIEAHERGHQVRHFTKKEIAPYFYALFGNAVDINKLEYSRETFEKEKTLFSEGTTYEQALEHTHEYFGDPDEIVERMSQLKNYFGMKPKEIFTKAHLDYARKHYAQEEHDNMMTEFFTMITPEKEKRFLEVMNSVGV